MRKLLLILVLVLLIIGNIFSQTKPMVFAKWAPASLAAGKVTIGSEFSFTRKSSIDLMIGIPASANHRITFDDEESDLNTKAFSVLLGYRYYLGKRQARGVYLEPYAKYLRHEADGILETELDGRDAKLATRTTYKGFGAGAQIGVQFMIFKRLSVDFYFLGLESNAARFSSSSTDVANNLPWTFAQSDDARQEIEDAIEDIPVLRDKMSVTINQATKNVSTDFKGFLPGLRIGASIGFRF